MQARLPATNEGGLVIAVSDEPVRPVRQLVHLLCESTNRLGQERTELTNFFVVSLADKLTSAADLADDVLWAIDLTGEAGETVPFLPLQAPADTYSIPVFPATAAMPDVAQAIESLRARIGRDIAQLTADAFDARDPLVAVLVAGVSPAEEARIGAALDLLRGESLWTEPDRSWSPTILLVGVNVDDMEVLERLAGLRDGVGVAAVRSEADIQQVTAYLAELARGSLVSGVSPLRYAAWVVAESSLSLGPARDDGAREVVNRTGSGDPTDLVYVRLPRGTGRFGDLLDLVSLRGRVRRPGEPDFPDGRALWPVRVVVGEEPYAPVGLIEPARPAGYDGEVFRLVDDGSPADPVSPMTRALICAELAGTVALAHDAGMVLGNRALYSARYRTSPHLAVLLVDCREAIPARYMGPAGPRAELSTLARLIERIAGDVGMSLSGGLPSATAWRDHLLAWAAALVGPPVIESVEVLPLTVASGAEVELRWRCRDADQVVVVGPDGVVVTPDGQDPVAGSVRISMTKPGAVNLYAFGKGGRSDAATDWISVVPSAMPADIRVPFPVRRTPGEAS
jgi:hypothetical protein